MVRTPVGVDCPGLPVEQVEAPISMPLRYTKMSCFGIETMIATGLGRALGVPDELTWLETGEVAIEVRSTLGQRQ
jgi:hypothetical protein